MSQITLENVSKLWGATKAVDSISFAADAASFLVLLGPSGCGKSTTLRLIAGLEQVSSGRILIGGTDVTDLPPAQRRIAMVFQSYALFPHLNVAENILFGLRVRKTPAAERARRLERVATLLGLTGLLDRKPSQLSGGQQQRVALGRAIIAETPVCLMDEPLSNLDAQLRADMRREIRALQQKLNVTMIYVTHDQTEAMSMADQVVLMRNGGIEQAGTPGEIYERPATAFAARFIGTPPMNILTLDEIDPGLAASCFAGLPDGRQKGLLLGIRPEHVVLADTGITANVATVEYLGADTIVTCTIHGHSLAARIPGKVTLATGAPVKIAWQPQHMHVFDAASGKRRDDLLAPVAREAKGNIQNCLA